MRLILRDYQTKEPVSERCLIDTGVYRLAAEGNTWEHEYAEALYFINNADCTTGIIADDWTDNGEPINPYMTFEVTK